MVCSKKLSKELEDKQKEADRLLEIADQYEGKTSDEVEYIDMPIPLRTFPISSTCL